MRILAQLREAESCYYQCCSATPTTSGTLTTIATDKSAIVLHYYGQWLLQEKLTTVSVMLALLGCLRPGHDAKGHMLAWCDYLMPRVRGGQLLSSKRELEGTGFHMAEALAQTKPNWSSQHLFIRN